LQRVRKRQERSSINEGLLADQPTRKDALGYYRLAQSVAKHIISLRADETPLTIGVYGPWGSGKTSFLSMVTEHLEISGAAPIWFHAWRYDQEEHLWAALLQTVLTKAPIDGGLWRRAAVRLGIWKDTINFGRGLLLNLKIFGPILRIVFVMLVIAFAMVWKTPIESAISVLPKGIEFSPFWTKLTLGVLAFIAARPDQLLKLFDTRLGLDLNAFRRNRTFREHIAFLDEFQDEFQRITKRISPARPLVIIIDDLDRCLPEKAIGVLEAVKQFLDVPNSVFLIALDPQIIERAILAKYKDTLNSDEADTQTGSLALLSAAYIDKIVQLPLTLPKVDDFHILRYTEGLLSPQELKPCAGVFVKGISFNPRRIKRALRVFVFLHELVREEPASEVLDALLLAKLVLIQHEFPKVYDELVRRPQLLPVLEQQSKGEALDEKLDPALVEVAKAFVDRFPDLRSALAVATDKHFDNDTVSRYLYFITPVSQAQSEMTDQLASQLTNREYLTRLLRSIEGQPTISFVAPVLRPLEGGVSEDRFIRFDDAARRSTRLFLLGPPGSGKTTIIYWVAQSCIRRIFGRPLSEHDAAIGISDSLVPVIIDAHRIDTRQDKEDIDLIELCRSLLESQDESMSDEHVREMLTYNKLWVLVDGLDELPPYARRKVADALVSLAASFPGLRCVATARSSASVGSLAGFATHEIQPLSQEQVGHAVSQWVDGLKLPDEQRAQVRAELLSHTALAGGSPLLLTLMLEVYSEFGVLPTSVADAVRQIVERLSLRERARTKYEFVVRRGFDVLEHFAIWLLRNGFDRISDMDGRDHVRRMAPTSEDAELVWEWVCNSPFLTEYSPGLHRFSHKTFQDFFAARAILNMGDEGMFLDGLRHQRRGFSDVLPFVLDGSPERGERLMMRALAANGKDLQLILTIANAVVLSRVIRPDVVADIRARVNRIIEDPTAEEHMKHEATRLKNALNSEPIVRDRRSWREAHAS
jgi:Cdc6-like AAA superfamily ATPase